jgi:hypothetical protein
MLHIEKWNISEIEPDYLLQGCAALKRIQAVLLSETYKDILLI